MTHSPPWMKTGPVNEDGNLSIGIRIANSTIKGIPVGVFWDGTWFEWLRLLYIYMYLYIYIWVFPKIGVPQNGWFIMEPSIKMDDLGVTLFSETSIFLLFP